MIDREVQHVDGRWFLARLLPYRTLEDKIDGVVITFMDITERKRAEQALLEAKNLLEARVSERTAALAAEIIERRKVEAARQALIRRLVSAQEEERREISREIHDQLGQQLTVLLFSLHALKESSYGRDETLDQIGGIEALVDTISQEMRQMARGLRPTVLDDLGLAVALSTYVEEWSQRTGLPVAFHSSGMHDGRLPAVLETTIYRVVMEALLNVLKHAHATQVSLILERRDDAAVAIIEDNGQGFDAESVLDQPAKWGLGILGMKERVALVGGTLTVESTPSVGATVFVRVPIAPVQNGGLDGQAPRPTG
jgi:two-component system CheB/CheR fusion protein